MRPFLLSLSLCLLALPATVAQTSPGGANLPQIPFGQVYKDFQFPLYQNGQLSATFSAVSATGVTINRAETLDLKIDLYTAGKVTTTITSPKADLYVGERIMRTKNTVHIERADLTATAQSCDFDLVSKKYLLRQNVRVLLKHFDIGSESKDANSVLPRTSSSSPGSMPETPPPPQPDESMIPIPNHPGESPIDIPGASATTNAAPSSPSSPIAP
jgi:hypothetical protein